MDINKTLQELKQRPGFAENVGMVLVHNGVARSRARDSRAPVRALDVRVDRARMDAICRELEQEPGIFAIIADCEEGQRQPGDDVLFLVVAGDIREHVKATFATLLDRVKAEAIHKVEQPGVERPEAG